MPECSLAWAALRAQVEEQALPQLAALVPGGGATPRILMSGAVVSRPGAGPQSFHIDGTGRLVNVFVPLVDVAPDSDGTQFWPGSHLDLAAPDAAPELEDNAAAMAAMVSPGCPAGGFLCFDYRCVHRGLANALRERAVAYFVVALEPGVEDSHNFPHLSVLNAPAELTETMPFWDDGVTTTPRYSLPPPIQPHLAPRPHLHPHAQRHPIPGGPRDHRAADAARCQLPEAGSGATARRGGDEAAGARLLRDFRARVELTAGARERREGVAARSGLPHTLNG